MQNLNDELLVELGDSLIMRWATGDDIDELAEFNIRLHSDNPDEPQLWLGEWTRDLMEGNHPTTNAADFTLIIDQNQGDKIVSSLCLISQTWTYAGMPFRVGRIELVGTDPAYRRRGLVRCQMEIIHKRSAAKGELIQAITGIPWYYRQFGYEMALNLGGSRELFWARFGNDNPQEEELFKMRPALATDIPKLDELYRFHCGQSLISCRRDKQSWEFGLFKASSCTPGRQRAQIIEDAEGHVHAYVDFWPWRSAFTVREVGVKPGSSWREVCLFLVRQLKLQADMLNETREKSITNIYFSLGESHSVYNALDDQLERPQKPYAWYIRVPDLKRFLDHISPLLERRLEQSVVAGYSGKLRLNFYRDNLCLKFEQGRLTAVNNYEPQNVEDADALFPELTFLQLAFGYRSYKELDYSFADCYAKNTEATILLNALFPRCPSDINPL